jgi:type VI secretion system protein ImpE
VQSADELLRGGDIDGARAALVENVRAKPADERARMFLFQLLCVAGEWEKARNQLNTLAKLSAEAQMLAVAYGQAIDAELTRARVFSGQEKPVQLVESAWAEDLAQAIHHFARGETEQGEEARERAFSAAPDTPGTLDDTRFEWIADADSRFGPSIEAIISGKYGIVPFDVIERIESAGAKDLRDTVWYPVQMAFRSGQSVAAMLPARYPGSEACSDVNERLGRSTNWTSQAWGQSGSGQRLWMLSNDEEHELLSLRTLVFE